MDRLTDPALTMREYDQPSPRITVLNPNPIIFLFYAHICRSLFTMATEDNSLGRSDQEYNNAVQIMYFEGWVRCFLDGQFSAL